MKDLGKKVRIGHMVSDIVNADAPDDVWGYTGCRNLKVHVATNLHPEQRYEAFWHEAVHTHLFNIGLQELGADEVAIQAIA